MRMQEFARYSWTSSYIASQLLRFALGETTISLPFVCSLKIIFKRGICFCIGFMLVELVAYGLLPQQELLLFSIAN